MLRLVYFVCFLASVNALDVRSCSSKKPLPLRVTVDGCDKEPCRVVNKKRIHFAIDFEAPENTNKLRAHAEAYLDNVRLPYDVPKEDLLACNFLKGAQCPLTKGQQVHYELTAPVDAPYSGPVVELKFELIDDNGISVFCLKTKVLIVPK